MLIILFSVVNVLAWQEECVFLLLEPSKRKKCTVRNVAGNFEAVINGKDLPVFYLYAEGYEKWEALLPHARFSAETLNGTTEALKVR